jgi:peptide/nickel transport system permease protein
VLLVWLVLTQQVDPDKRALVRWLGVGGLLAIIVVYWIFFTGGAVPYMIDIAWHLALPVLTLTLISFAGTMLLTRNSMLETLREDYILTARAKGLPEKTVRDKHAARNAMLPVVTSLVFSLAFALDGGVITESVFSWPGMGRTIVGAVQTSDIPTAIGGLVFTGALALTAHLVADILYVYLDPRVRYS